MATTIATLIANARTTLLETSARFWTDAELLVHANNGAKDLWKAVIDLLQDHHITFDTTNMSLAASTDTVQGVPTNLFRVKVIKPRIVGASSDNRGLVFKNLKSITHPDFVQAQAARACAPRYRVLYYVVVNAGAPVAAPAIKIAPMVSSAVNLEVDYVPVIGALVSGDANPIPGESDLALTAYIIAWARAKERDDRSPDPEYISIYATEKRNMMTVLDERSEQDVEVVEAFWGPGYDDGF